MPPIQPNSGYGPANYSGARSEGPDVPFDSTINYNNMAQYQAVTQYQQLANPAPIYQQRSVVAGDQYQYGTNQQNMRFYNRQQDLSRQAWSGAIANAAMYQAAFTAAEIPVGLAGAAMTAAGAAGGLGVAGFAAAALAPMVPMYFTGRGVQRSMERQAYMHGIANDLESYKSRLGFNSLTYNEASRAGGSLAVGMESPNQFFNKEQQMRIHKIALANDMISAKGIGMQSGSVEQYRKNFDELKETTKDVVKLLKTTIEGGMSVMKELQGAGFSSYKQIRQQVLQATAYGATTGIGSQNMMQVGLAGAQSVQGTMWTAQTGASMYQTGAASAANVARSSALGAYAVERVGGVAQAGGVIARATMNLAMSGIGTRLAAYAMNADGTVNSERMQKMMTGAVTGYGISTGSAASGYAMGPSGRALFPMWKEQFYNNLNDQGRSMMFMKGFEAWGASRPYASTQAKAYVFAGQYTQDPREQALVMQYILGGKGYAQQSASVAAQSLMSQNINFDPAKSAIGAWYNRSKLGDLERFGSRTYSDVDNAMYGMSAGITNMKRGASRWASGAFGGMAANLLGEETLRSGLWSTQLPMDRATNINRSLGLESYGGGAVGERGYAAMSSKQTGYMRIKGIPLTKQQNAALSAMSAESALYITKQLQSASFSDTPTAAINNILTGDTRFKSIMMQNNLGGLFNQLSANPTATALSTIGSMRTNGFSVHAQQQESMGAWNRLVSTSTNADRIRAESRVAAAIETVTGFAAGGDTRTKLMNASNASEFNAITQDIVKNNTWASMSAGQAPSFIPSAQKLTDVEFGRVKSQLNKGKEVLAFAAGNEVSIDEARKIQTSTASELLGGLAYGGSMANKKNLSYAGDRGRLFRGGRASNLRALASELGVSNFGQGTSQEAKERTMVDLTEKMYQFMISPEVSSDDKAIKEKRSRIYKSWKDATYQDLTPGSEDSKKFIEGYIKIQNQNATLSGATGRAAANTWESYAVTKGLFNADGKSEAVKLIKEAIGGGGATRTIDWSDKTLFKTGEIDKIAASFGVAPDTLRGAKTYGDVKAIANAQEKAFDSSTKGISDLANSIIELNRTMAGASAEEKLKIQEQIKTQESLLGAKLALSKEGDRQTGTGTPIATTPPILNYWSNQWVL